MAGLPSLAPVALDDRGSFAWIADPSDALARASVAIALDGGCLVADPVDVPGLGEALEVIGPVLGVATLLDRHQRDAALLASRFGVPRLTPLALGGAGIGLPGVEERAVVELKRWKESLLWIPDRRLLVCVETLGTVPYFLARPGDALGLHPFARLLDVRPAFEGLEPAAVVVGHGLPLLTNAAAELAGVLATQRRSLPRAWLNAARAAFRSVR